VGGFAKGDRVVSKINHTDGDRTIKIGDIGVVNCRCNNPLLDRADERVNCTFPNFGNVNITSDESTIGHVPIVGGFAKGDRVVSKINHTDGDRNIKIGDIGVVNGRCNNPLLDRADERVNCSFPNFGNVNITSDERTIGHVPIVGGFAKGDFVVSRINHTDGDRNIKIGDVGVVNGRCNNPLLARADVRVNCSFPNFGNVNITSDERTIGHAPIDVNVERAMAALVIRAPVSRSPEKPTELNPSQQPKATAPPPPVVAATTPRSRPAEHYCAITTDVMQDPVIVAACGDTFERAAILQWFQRTATCPLCREPSDKVVVTNKAVRIMIQDWKP
jgi:ribosomal protein S24E